MAEGQGPTVAGQEATSPVHPPAAPFASANVGRTTRELLNQWKTQAETRAIAQQLVAVSEARINRALGISVTALATIGGTSVFASLLTSGNPAVVLIAGAFTVIAAALSGIQTSLALGESSGAHRSASAGFLGLKERLEIAIAFHDEGKEVTKKELEDFAKDAEELERGTKPVPEETYRKAIAQAERDAAS